MERLDRHADDDRAGRIHIPGSGVHGQGCEGRQFRIRPADRRPAAPIPAQKSQLNTGADAGRNTTYGFESNRINTYNLVYNNSLLFLSLQSWNSVDASAGFGQTAENNPTFSFDLSLGPTPPQGTGYYFLTQSQQIAEHSETSELNYPKDPTEDPYVMYDDPRPLPKNKFIYRTDHLNNTYLSSVLLGGNGPQSRRTRAEDYIPTASDPTSNCR